MSRFDKLVITAVSALNHQHWKPPGLYDKDRGKWQLPVDLAQTDGFEKQSGNQSRSQQVK